MTKINILVGMTLLVLTAANRQDNTIISMQSDVHCENGSIPAEYLHQSLYACADANFLPSTSTIMFSVSFICFINLYLCNNFIIFEFI